MNERNLEGSSDFLVFFDNIRVDQFTTNFRTAISVSGGMGTASLDFIYVPDFYQPEDPGLVKDSVVEQGFEYMTTVRIFSKNMFNNRYIQIFEGNLRSAGRVKTRMGYGISFNATDYMTWYNRTIVPLAIPYTATYKDQVDILRWRAQGIDTNLVDSIVRTNDITLKGKNLREYTNEIIKRTLQNNKLFTEENSVAAWDNPTSRLYLMGDIDPLLVDSEVMDCMLQTTATSLNSIYVAFNDIARNLMFEFFQDRDGIVRLKPPFWGEAIPRDHIIDPMMIVASAEDTDYSHMYTRIAVAGNMEEWERKSDYDVSGMMTPAVVYVGDMEDVNKEYVARSKSY